MYVPDHYKEENKYVIADFINEHSFGTLISTIKGKPYATQTPFLAELDNNQEITLFGHISTHNEQKDSLLEKSEVICVFNGPHSYISPSWYVEPNVPTWNYKTVQLTGEINIKSGKDAMDIMEKMVNHYERGMIKPVKISDIPLSILNEDIEGIHVFEIKVTEVAASFKLSQNKDDISFSRIIRELKKQDDYDAMLIAFEMEQILKKRKKMA
jgi:transcriptional regulator